MAVKSPADAFVEGLIESIVQGVSERLRGEMPSATIKPRLLTVEAAAEYLSRSPASVRQLIHRGHDPYREDGRARVFGYPRSG